MTDKDNDLAFLLCAISKVPGILELCVLVFSCSDSKNTRKTIRTPEFQTYTITKDVPVNHKNPGDWILLSYSDHINTYIYTIYRLIITIIIFVMNALTLYR